MQIINNNTQRNIKLIQKEITIETQQVNKTQETVADNVYSESQFMKQPHFFDKQSENPILIVNDSKPDISNT